MAYDGFLIKVGNYTIPHSVIRLESYQVYRSVQDLDSYADANGQLHRTALEHVPCKVEFETPALMTASVFADLMNNIRGQFVNALERKGLVTLYVPETDSYETQYMYMPDIQPTIYSVHTGQPQYNSIRLAFIGY